MDEKVVRFDLSPQRLYELAEKKFEEKDYIAALRILRKSAEENGAGSDELALFADIYDEMEIFDESANYWFYFLEQCSDEEAIDACEGLAACYYNLGNDLQAAYYYNLMIQNKFYTPEDGLGLSEMFSSAPPVRKPFKIVYPPEEADYSETVDAGLKALKSGDYAKAEEAFLSVHPKADYYMSAQNFLAVCYLMQGKNEQAEKVCRALLEKEPDDVQVLSTYAAVLTETDRREESRAVAERLAAFDTQSADELYKIATVCCENHLYEEALEKFRILSGTVRYDRTLLFFKGVAALRCGKLQESLSAFGTILDVWPDAEVARYYYDAVREFSEGKTSLPDLGFFYRLPKAEREGRVRLLKALLSLPVAELHAYCTQTDLQPLLRWCFDEEDGQLPDLQMLALAVAERADMRSFLADVLLKSTVNDVIKVEAVYRICCRNRAFECGVVLANDYHKIGFDRLQTGRKKHKIFVQAYAQCIARFSLFGDGAGEEYRQAAQALYAAAESAGALDGLKAENITATLYYAVSPFAKMRGDDVLRILKADPESVAHLQEIAASWRQIASEAAATEASAAEVSAAEEEKDDETH